jgi:predicted RNA-binding Zn ribbon-like protein
MTAAKTSSRFVTEAAALDFLNALNPSEVRFERDSFARWLKDRGLVPADALNEIEASADLGELEAVTAQAKVLSDWFRGLIKELMGKPLSSSVAERLTPLNRILKRDTSFHLIEMRDELDDRIAGSGLKLLTMRDWRSPSILLLPIAEAMADMLCTEDFTNVRVCEGPGCGFLFVDRTGKGTRRWCSMALCGNRAKQAKAKQGTGTV